jgi:hypothetical protein
MIYTHVLNKGGRGVLSPLDGYSFSPLDGRLPGAPGVVAQARAA